MKKEVFTNNVAVNFLFETRVQNKLRNLGSLPASGGALDNDALASFNHRNYTIFHRCYGQIRLGPISEVKGFVYLGQFDCVDIMNVWNGALGNKIANGTLKIIPGIPALCD